MDVRAFVAEVSDRGLSASRLRQIRHLLGMIFRAAVENGAIARTPVVGIKIPREQKREMKILSVEQFQTLVSAMPARYRALVLTLGLGGLRWGEAAALRRRDVNLSALASTLVHGPYKIRISSMLYEPILRYLPFVIHRRHPV